MSTSLVSHLYTSTAAALKPIAGELAFLEARILLSHLLELSQDDIALSLYNRDLNIDNAKPALLDAWIQRRLNNEPIARIVGSREFWDMTFVITPDTLDPRPDSETLIEAVRQHTTKLGTYPNKILDLGTGSGCLLITLLTLFPEAEGWGVDISPQALGIARHNAAVHHVHQRCTWIEGSWLEASIGKDFDIIISNPPYIPTPDIATLSPEVREHDPLIALDGGQDGLDCYRALIPLAWSALAPGGIVFFEVGYNQSANVSTLLEAQGFLNVTQAKDLAGISRVVWGYKTQASIHQA